MAHLINVINQKMLDIRDSARAGNPPLEGITYEVDEGALLASLDTHGKIDGNIGFTLIDDTTDHLASIKVLILNEVVPASGEDATYELHEWDGTITKIFDGQGADHIVLTPNDHEYAEALGAICKASVEAER